MEKDNITLTTERPASATAQKDSSPSLSQIFRLAILAGISISIGCVVFLRVGGVAGAVLFALGLLTCVHFRLPLYTGTAGFVMNRDELSRLALILCGNIVGCLLMALGMRYAQPEICDSAAAIAAKRLALSPMQIVVLAILCGFLMTVAVKFAREKSFIPLLFAVPVFILSGFIHSIADAFYLLASPLDVLSADWGDTLSNYAMAVIGNFVGCNLYRILNFKLAY